MKSCSGLPGGTPAATGDSSSATWGMAIYQPSSKLFVTTGGSSNVPVFVCNQNNGVVSGCVSAGVPTGLLGNAADIVFFGGSAVIADRNNGVFTCKVSAPGAGLEYCVNINTFNSAFGLLLV